MASCSSHDIIKICAYCENAECLNNPDIMLCNINGIVASDHKCRRFLYDPLKRNPSPPIKISDFDKDAFIL